MLTTLSFPEELLSQARELVGERSLRDFVLDAVRRRVQELAADRLAQEMEAGYRAEAKNPSLDPKWSALEVEGW